MVDGRPEFPYLSSLIFIVLCCTFTQLNLRLILSTSVGQVTTDHCCFCYMRSVLCVIYLSGPGSPLWHIVLDVGHCLSPGNFTPGEWVPSENIGRPGSRSKDLVYLCVLGIKRYRERSNCCGYSSQNEGVGSRTC